MQSYAGVYTVEYDDTRSNSNQHFPEQTQTFQTSDAGPMRRNKRGKANFRPFQGSPRKKKISLNPKNAVLLLNEVKPGLDYAFTDVDPAIDTKSFKCCLTVNDCEYCAVASSKKEARRKVAENALRGQIYLKNNDVYEKLANKIMTANAGQSLVTEEEILKLIDTTSVKLSSTEEKHPVMLLNQRFGRVLEYERVMSDAAGVVTVKVSPLEGHTFEGTGSTLDLAKIDAASKALQNLTEAGAASSQTVNIMKEYVTLLQELHHYNLEYSVVLEDDNHVVMKVTVDGTEFEGTGKTKKAAKSHAAKTALAHLHGILGDMSVSEINGVSVYKSPVTILQEYTSPNIKYEYVNNTGAIVSEFTACVVVNGITFSGTALNKKVAKCIAANKALKQIFGVHIPNSVSEGINEGPEENRVSFLNVKPEHVQEHPCNVLNLLVNEKLVYTCTKEDGVITASVLVFGREYVGKGKKAKEARDLAARAALSQEFKIDAKPAKLE